MRNQISPAVIGPRLLEIGKIKIGGKGEERSTSGGKKMRLPKRFDHFRVTTRIRGDDENFVLDEAVHEHPDVGEKPRELRCRLPFNTSEECFHSRMVRYEGRKRLFECDGETLLNRKTGSEGPCERMASGQCQCKPSGRFPVILEASAQLGGYYTYRTTSYESIASIQTTLAMLEEQFGSLRGLPLKLVLNPVEDTYGDGKVSTNWKVGIVLAIAWEEARAMALEFHRANQIAAQEVRLLASGVSIDLDREEDEDEEHIADEFHPDVNAEADVETQSKVDALKQEMGVGTAPAEDQEAEDLAERQALFERYQVLFEELVEDPTKRRLARRAYQSFGVKDAGTDLAGWSTETLRAAVDDLESEGIKTVRAALRRAQKESTPASDEDVETLKRLIDASDLDAGKAAEVWAVIESGVGEWIRTEIQKFKLAGIGARDSEQRSFV